MYEHCGLRYACTVIIAVQLVCLRRKSEGSANGVQIGSLLVQGQGAAPSAGYRPGAGRAGTIFVGPLCMQSSLENHYGDT